MNSTTNNISFQGAFLFRTPTTTVRATIDKSLHDKTHLKFDQFSNKANVLYVVPQNKDFAFCKILNKLRKNLLVEYYPSISLDDPMNINIKDIAERATAQDGKGVRSIESIQKYIINSIGQKKFGEKVTIITDIIGTHMKKKFSAEEISPDAKKGVLHITDNSNNVHVIVFPKGKKDPSHLCVCVDRKDNHGDKKSDFYILNKDYTINKVCESLDDIRTFKKLTIAKLEEYAKTHKFTSLESFSDKNF
ncbi:MAG: hypothetical protein MJ237_08200 [bacterium]|nr:hypothetical protein [bacterium]